MGERLLTNEDMATTSATVSTVPPQQIQEEPVERPAVITLRATRAESRKKVVWTEDTVDNEHMNKKKSKCCCIYEKPHKFGESESEESDDECEHCFGHVEKRKMKQQERDATADTVVLQETSSEPSVAVTLRPDPAPPAPPDIPGKDTVDPAS